MIGRESYLLQIQEINQKKKKEITKEETFMAERLSFIVCSAAVALNSLSISQRNRTGKL